MLLVWKSEQVHVNDSFPNNDFEAVQKNHFLLTVKPTYHYNYPQAFDIDGTHHRLMGLNMVLETKKLI